MDVNEKGHTGWNQVTLQSNSDTSNHTPIFVRIKGKITVRAWALQYGLEDARLRYANKGQLVRQAGACLILALLRASGVRYV